jgi:GNAT superfamily N-acetyltransferase
LLVEPLEMNYAVRALTVEDEPTLWTMLMHAAHEPSLEAVQRQPCLTRYVRDWGRVSDMGFVACVGELSIGAAWLRLWSMGDQGFGSIDDATPELAMAVLPEYRGQGVGTQLLSQILKIAQGLFPAVCLSVRAENPVAKLYERVGFIKVEGSEVMNRTGGISFTMVRRLIV